MSNWFVHVIRARYQETDRMGVVYHTNYLNWFEFGRTELIRTQGTAYRSVEELGLLLPVVEADMKFRMPAKYDDVIAIYTKVSSASAIRMAFESQIRRLDETASSRIGQSVRLEDKDPEGELLVSGSTRHVWLNRDWKPARLDRVSPELYELIIAGTDDSN
jgi:acyl-CoA thioester hydrolase